MCCVLQCFIDIKHVYGSVFEFNKCTEKENVLYHRHLCTFIEISSSRTKALVCSHLQNLSFELTRTLTKESIGYK